MTKELKQGANLPESDPQMSFAYPRAWFAHAQERS